MKFSLQLFNPARINHHLIILDLLLDHRL